MKRAMIPQASPLDGYPKEEGGDWLIILEDLMNVLPAHSNVTDTVIVRG
jgi:hypothetical protein